jgi:hypothetical protein
MKITTGIAIAAAILATATSIPAQAAKNSNMHAQREASCKAQAAKKFSGIHFMKRHSFVNDCMGRNTQAKAKVSKSKVATVHHTEIGARKAPTTTGQSVK